MIMKRLTLSIQNPCNENWDNMEPRSLGKHCLSCNKTVVDFTNFTDEQLLQFFQKPQGSICGRIEQERLNIPMIIPPLTKRNRIQWLFPLAAILSFLGINKAKAQDTAYSAKKINTEKVSYDMNNQAIKKVKQPFIEILVLDKDGKIMTDNFFIKVSCWHFDTLKYTYHNGLIKIPTNQFIKEEDISIEISDYVYRELILVSQFSLSQYEVVLKSMKAIPLFSFESRTPVMHAMGGAISVTTSSSRSFFNFQSITILPTIQSDELYPTIELKHLPK